MRTIDLKNRKIDYDSLLKFGFTYENDNYIYKEKILNNEFEVLITIDNNIVTTKLVEIDFNDEYMLIDNNDAVGEYVGLVKDTYQIVINKFLDKCTIKEIYKSINSKKIVEYVKNTYNVSLEFLWEKYDDAGIWRNKNNNKWFGLIMTVVGNKIGIESDDKIEILNVTYQKDKINAIIDNVNIFPGYHMNKKSWITIRLDNNFDIKKIVELVDNSYNIIDGSKR